MSQRAAHEVRSGRAGRSNADVALVLGLSPNHLEGAYSFITFLDFIILLAFHDVCAPEQIGTALWACITPRSEARPHRGATIVTCNLLARPVVLL